MYTITNKTTHNMMQEVFPKLVQLMLNRMCSSPSPQNTNHDFDNDLVEVSSQSLCVPINLHQKINQHLRFTLFITYNGVIFLAMI